MKTIRPFVTALIFAAISAGACGAAESSGSPSANQPLNILFFVADDCNWDSVGAFGCPIPDLTPNIDRLASQGARLPHAYSTVAVCTPVRATMMTGLLPHHSGCEGFEPIRNHVTTLNERLHQAGYFISMFGKNGGYKPHAKYCIDDEWQSERGNRNAEKIHEYVAEVAARAKQAGKPFFCHMNCADPHRPFYGSAEAEKLARTSPEKFGIPSRVIRPEEVQVPRFLDEIPGVRTELAQYFSCVRRLDDCVGAALRALSESGQEENTLVLLYTGDHGMSFPFAKSNAYLQSNRGGLIIRWPGVVKCGSIIDGSMVSTLDFTPTLLEAANLPAIPNLDGRSFVPLLKGGSQEGRDFVFCYYYRTAGEKYFPMRSVRTRTDAYIWNPWSDGRNRYQAENMSGISWKAMLEKARSDPSMRKRCDDYLYRAPEEYFLDTEDAGERNNLIRSAPHQERITTLQAALEKHLKATGDPLAESFSRRHDPETMARLHKDLLEKNDKKTSGNIQLKPSSNHRE